MIGVKARSPLAHSAADPSRQPRHCAYCGRGLSRKFRARYTPEERLLAAIFGAGPACIDCAPTMLARIGRKGSR